jgi:hypothetical protein
MGSASGRLACRERLLWLYLRRAICIQYFKTDGGGCQIVRKAECIPKGAPRRHRHDYRGNSAPACSYYRCSTLGGQFRAERGSLSLLYLTLVSIDRKCQMYVYVYVRTARQMIANGLGIVGLLCCQQCCRRAIGVISSWARGAAGVRVCYVLLLAIHTAPTLIPAPRLARQFQNFQVQFQQPLMCGRCRTGADALHFGPSAKQPQASLARAVAWPNH